MCLQPTDASGDSSVQFHFKHEPFDVVDAGREAPAAGTRVGFAALPTTAGADMWHHQVWYVCLRSGEYWESGVRAGAIEGWVPPIPGDVVEVSLDTGTGEFSVSSCGRIAVVCAVACPDPLYFVVGAHDYAVRFLSRARGRGAPIVRCDGAQVMLLCTQGWGNTSSVERSVRLLL
jgi:hypothetical protein